MAALHRAAVYGSIAKSSAERQAQGIEPFREAVTEKEYFNMIACLSDNDLPIGKSSTERQAQESKQGLGKLTPSFSKDTSELESMAHQHVNSDEVMVVKKLTISQGLQNFRIIKEDFSLDFTANYSYDSPPIGKSSTDESQAQGSMKEWKLRRILQATMIIIEVFFALTVSHLYDSPLNGKSSTDESQAQGSMKEWNLWRIFPAITRRSRRTCHSSNSWASSNNTMDVSLKARDHNKKGANMQKASSWLTVMTFPGCLLLSNYRHSLCNEQGSLSIWLALLGMFNFTTFLSSLFLMVICGAHFTRVQVITLVISAMPIISAYTITAGSTVPVLGILLSG